MTRPKDQPARRSRGIGPTWAAVCALAVVSAPVPALAQDMPAQEMDEAEPAVPVAPPVSGGVAEMQGQAAPEVVDRRQADMEWEASRQAGERWSDEQRSMDDSLAPLDMPPVTAGPPSTQTLYGPPSPKVRDGQLANIGWTEPDRHVPPALEEAVNLVTKNYPSALSARAALRAAASDVRAAKWLRFPSLTGNLAYLDDASKPEPQLIVEAPIWSGGRIGSNIRQAKAEEEVSSATYVRTVQDLALTTARAYFEVVRLTQREQLLESSLAEHLKLVRTMERRVEQEISPLADLELARSRSAQIEQDYTNTIAQRRTTLRILAELIADPSYQLGPVPHYEAETTMDARETLEEQAIAYSPELKRLQGEADVARAELDGRKATILPQLNAQYSYDDVFGSRVGLVVRAQSAGGLSQFSEVNSARLRIQSALENIRVAEQQLRREVESALIQYDAAKRRAEISQTAASTAARVSASYTRQFIAGRRSWLDVMNALREAVTAEIGRTEAEVTVMATATQLLLQSGRWRPVFSGPEL